MKAKEVVGSVCWWIVYVKNNYVGTWYGTKEHALTRARSYGESFGVTEPPMFEARKA